MINTKQLAGEKAATYIKNGMTIGLGTGSTAYYAIQKIGQMVKNGLAIKAIATSLQSENMAKELGIPLTSFGETEEIDITIDGADEIDEYFQLIKGGGGALLREKIVAAATKYYIIIADESKLVKHLGNFPLPVEVVSFGYQSTLKKIISVGCRAVLRKKDNSIFITDNGNYIADCSFGTIADPASIHEQINAIIGVVETGLFINMTDLVITCLADGSLKVLPNTRPFL